MVVTSVEKFGNQDTVKLSAVSKGPYGPNGENEDNDYARWTPSASVTIGIANPALIGQFHPGDVLYVDFTPVPTDPATATA